MISVNTDICTLLRAATRSGHRALDHHALLAPLLNAPPNVSDYAHALASLYGVWAAWECAAKTAAEILGWPLPIDSRVVALQADLLALAQTPYTFAQEPPSVENIAQLIGVLYVLEGSRFGGQFLWTRLSPHIPKHALNFFHQPDPELHKEWAAFCQIANEKITTAQYPICLDMAQHVFISINTHLNACQRQAETT